MTEPTEATTTSTSATPYMKPLPEPTDVSRPFWEAARRHQLLIQRSKQTGKYVFYPRAVSPFAPGDVLDHQARSGRDVVDAEDADQVRVVAVGRQPRRARRGDYQRGGIVGGMDRTGHDGTRFTAA